jgi:hypothetical protein
MVLQKRYECPNGDVWEEYYSEYPNDKYFEGGKDEVIQIKKNGREEGHITWHYDGVLLSETLRSRRRSCATWLPD